ncbi:DNA-3-methyladenine glycosylase family protein [[Eubacterium] cellulosolvens]
MKIKLDDLNCLDLDLTFSCGQVFRWRKLDNSWIGMIDDVLLKLRVEDNYLNVQSSEPIHNSRVKEFFRFDDRFDIIMKQLNRNKEFKEISSSIKGLRLLRQDPWECLISYICSRNCKIVMINRMLFDLSKNLGKKVSWDNFTDYCFPSPEIISKSKLTELSRCRFRFGKIQANEIREIAKVVCSKELDFDKVKKMSYPEAKVKLMSIGHGIGNKVADCVLLFSLDKLESFPVDVWIARALIELYGQQFNSKLINKIKRKQNLTPKEYTLLSDFGRQYFGKYAGYAQEYIYHWKRLRNGVC